jgi:uncharacterized glyoxalase superfamily protein PhnB
MCMPGRAGASRRKSCLKRFWLNLENRQYVDELYQRWRDAGARILAAPEDKPWRLREFRTGDLDGNQLRVFYDFSWELEQDKA